MITNRFCMMLLLMIICASNSFCLEVNDAPDYIYFNMNGGVVVGLYKGIPKILIGDRVEEIVDCSTKTVSCLESEGVLIAIPTESVGYFRDGTKVVATNKIEWNFFGKKAYVRIIDAHRGDVNYRYWYSDDVGLLAFSIAASGKSATYLLQQSEGLKSRRLETPK